MASVFEAADYFRINQNRSQFCQITLNFPVVSVICLLLYVSMLAFVCRFKKKIFLSIPSLRVTNRSLNTIVVFNRIPSLIACEYSRLSPFPAATQANLPLV